MAGSGRGWRSWGAELGKSKANKVKPIRKRQRKHMSNNKHWIYPTSITATGKNVHHVSHIWCVELWSVRGTTFYTIMTPRRQLALCYVISHTQNHVTLYRIRHDRDLTCCGVRQLFWRSLWDSQRSQERQEVSPQSDGDREVALFNHIGRKSGTGTLWTLLHPPAGETGRDTKSVTRTYRITVITAQSDSFYTFNVTQVETIYISV